MLAACWAAPGSAAPASDKSLQIISIDLEGGGGTLFITPEGKTLLIDSGWPDGRPGEQKTSAQRIVDTVHSFGFQKIDYFLLTHYHIDHIGGFSSLFSKIPIGTFIDHGPNRQIGPDSPPRPGAPPRTGPMAKSTQESYDEYIGLIKGRRHIVAKPGNHLDIGSLHLTFVGADAKFIDMGKVPGSGGSDPYCDHFVMQDRDGGEENARSTASLITFGKVRIAALGDLTWNREKDLFCPNRVGPVDIEIATNHGTELSDSPASVNGLRPLVVIVGNGQRKGGDASVLKTFDGDPRLQGLWKLHTSVAHHETDGDLNMIANTDDDIAKDKLYNLRVRVTKDGKITVINERNGFNKTYLAKGATD
jgi:competence protein ComEC